VDDETTGDISRTAARPPGEEQPMKPYTNSRQIHIAVMAALGAAAMSVASTSAVAAKGEGQYLTGDFHNHSTCSDGSISMQKLVKKSMDKQDTPWGLDWFVQAGHGGSGTRNCTLAEDESLATPAFPLVFSTTGQLQGPGTTWQNTNPPIEPKGRASGTPPNRIMWRWQSLQEVQYPLLEYLSGAQNKPLFLGLESVVAGHEHTSMSVITGQMPAGIEAARNQTTPGYKPLGNANALAQWSYCFDRGDTDTSRGNTTETSGIGNNWDCGVPGSPNSTSPSLGWSDAARKLIPNAAGLPTTTVGDRGHAKTVEAVRWMAQFHGEQSYYVPAHLERAGPFNPAGNNGFNIEHLRNLNNAAPRVAFGFETQPGHGASGDRGEYRPARNNIGGVLVDSVGGTTYGGTGVYGALVGGVWDALLGEGRNWWFFASSDWHNRGSFGPDDRRSTNDFYPGEYQRNYTLVVADDARRNPGVRPTPQQIVDGLRTGNGFADSGQLIDRLAFVACLGNPGAHGRSNQAVETLAIDAALDNESPVMKGCATMGQKLEVPAGRDVVVSIVVRDPTGTSYAPYTFNNPSLAQVGIEQPLNRPVLDHVDVIRGLVTGYRQPGSPDYAGAWPNTWLLNPDLATVPAAAKNPSAAVIKTFNSATWRTVSRAPEFKAMTFRLSAVQASQYVRLRGTNLPAGVPFETDANGNPLSDIHTNVIQDRDVSRLAIKCTVTGKNLPANDVTYTGTGIDGCPEHMPVKEGQKYVAFDVAAWADLWFYSNPIYLEVDGSTLVAGVR
jgi:hypothetical protein